MTKEQIEIIDLLIDRCQNEKFFAKENEKLKQQIEDLKTGQGYMEGYYNLQSKALLEIQNSIEWDENQVIDYKSHVQIIKNIIEIHNKEMESNY